MQSLKENGTIHVIKQSGCQSRSKLTGRETWKVRKMCVHHTSYTTMPGNSSKHIAIRVQKWNDKMYFSAENLPDVSPVVMNYKMRHNKNQSSRYSLVWPDRFFCYQSFVVAEKWKSTVWTCKATCKGNHGGRLAQCVSQPYRALVNCGRSMKIATFSTRDLQEHCHKYYVASQRANEGIGDLTNVLSQTTSMKVIRESFCP